MLRRNLKIYAAAFGTVFLLTRIPGRSQPPGSLTNDHPIVIDHLIHFYDGLSQQIAVRNTADPEHADSRQRGAVGLFRVSVAGYQSLAAVLSSAKARLDAVRGSQSKYVSTLAVGTPSPASVQATLQDFYQQQLAILQHVPVDLKAQLSAADWAALQGFITAELTAKIKVGPVFKPTGNAVGAPKQ